MNARTTARGHDFHATGAADRKRQLFTVSAGIPMLDALQSVSDLLDIMRDPLISAGMGEPLEGNPAWLVNNARESAKAVIDSLIDSLEFPDN
jgi:hypothetical protein